MFKNFKIVLWFLILTCGSLWAGVSVDISPDRVEEGKEFTFSLVIPMRELPKSYDFPRVLWPQGFELVSQDTSSEVKQDFFKGRYLVKKFDFTVKANASGKHTVGPITWFVNGKDNNLGKMDVNVQRSFDSPGMGVSARIDNKEVYEGEQLSFTLNFFAYSNFQQGPGPLQTGFGQNFWGELKEEAFKWEKSKSAAFIGQAYMKAYLSPITSGNLEIPRQGFKYVKIGEPKRVVKEEKSGNFSYRSETIQQEPIEDTVYTAPISIKVRPLPELNKPKNFSGLVGDYSMSVDFDRDSLLVGEPLTVKIKISGNGRPGFVPDPELPDLSDFKIVPPEIQQSTKVKNDKIISTKELTYFLYPRRQFNGELNGFSLNYFDVKTKEYKVIKAAPHKLIVNRSADGSIVEEETTNEKSEVNLATGAVEKPKVNTPNFSLVDIVKTKAKYDKPYYKSSNYWLLVLLALLSYPLFLILKKQYKVYLNKRPERDIKNAVNLAKNRFQALLKEDSKDDISKGINEVLVEFLSRKIKKPALGLTYIELERELKNQNQKEDYSFEWIDFLKELDSSKYGGATLSNQALIDKAHKLLDKWVEK